MEKILSLIGGGLAIIVLFTGTIWVVNNIQPVNEKSSQVEQITPADPQGDYYLENGSSDCTIDCSGHEAGYQWAEDNDVCDPDFDGGNSESFAEGVREYAYDNCYYEDENGAF
jgi:hypothetical protein